MLTFKDPQKAAFRKTLRKREKMLVNSRHCRQLETKQTLVITNIFLLVCKIVSEVLFQRVGKIQNCVYNRHTIPDLHGSKPYNWVTKYHEKIITGI